MSNHYEPHHEDPHHRPPHHEPPHHEPPRHHEPEHHSKCFIATAVHGENSVEVATLRRFRDDVLRTSSFGRAFIASYERLSPPLAAAIAERPALQNIARRVIVTPAYRLAKSRAPIESVKSENDES